MRKRRPVIIHLVQARPAPALRSLIRRALPTLLPLVLADLRGWTPALRTAAARQLRALVVLAEAGAVPHLPQLLAALTAAAGVPKSLALPLTCITCCAARRPRRARARRHRRSGRCGASDAAAGCSYCLRVAASPQKPPRWCGAWWCLHRRAGTLPQCALTAVTSAELFWHLLSACGVKAKPNVSDEDGCSYTA